MSSCLYLHPCQHLNYKSVKVQMKSGILFYSSEGITPGNDLQNLGPPQITSIVAFSKGFACSCGPGTVAWFEKTDDKEYFKKVCDISPLSGECRLNVLCQNSKLAN